MELGDSVDVHTVYIMASIKYIFIEPQVYLYSANIVLMFTFKSPVPPTQNTTHKIGLNKRRNFECKLKLFHQTSRTIR